LSEQRTRTAILISGSGSNLQSFIDQVACGELDLEIAVVVSNREHAYGLQRAAAAGIPGIFIAHDSFSNREDFDRAVAAALAEYSVDLVILAGFMRILSTWFVHRFSGRILNIHPALLPAYPGLDTHQRVLDAGDQLHGSTVHFVTEELDGGPLIMQGRLEIQPGESAADLAARVQSIEHRIYPECAALYAAGRLAFKEDAAYLDGRMLERPLVRDFT
jgi:phosphoribosylglycinamide formyltransferase-1